MAREFTLADAIGQQGGGTMKGASPVPRLTQVISEINQFIERNISDPPGALKFVMQRGIKGNEFYIAQHLDEPLVALREIIQYVLDRDSVLHEFVRQVDVQWGRVFMERPHFQQPGQEPHPDDEYTHESVRNQLSIFLGKVESAIKSGG